MKKTIKCLLIDDDLEDHEIFKMGLENTQLDATCHCFETCEKAVLFMADGIYQPDFLFLDWHLIGMNAMDCLFQLNKLPQIADCRVILYSSSCPPMTAFHMTEEQKRNTHYLRKSNSLSELTEDLKMIMIPSLMDS